MCPKKNALDKNHRNGSQCISLHKVDAGCAIFISKNFPEEFFFVESLHFTRENTISENEVLLIFPNHHHQVGRPPSGARISIKL